MTNLDQRLELLHADLTSRITAPPLASLIHQRQSARGRRLGAVLTAVAVVVALAAGALVARASHHPITGSAAPNPTTLIATTHRALPTTTTATANRTSPAAIANRSVASVAMADAHDGFALLQACTQEAVPCQVTSIAATQDGSRWVNYAVPAAPAYQGTTAYPNGVVAPAVTALGARSVFYQASASGPGFGYFSSDSGATWTAVPAGANGTVATIPAGGALQASCPPGGSDPCLTVALTVRRPSDGQLVKLTRQPDIAVESANAAPLADGAWWVTGNKAGKPAFAVSRDKGRTWTSLTMPVVPGQYLYTSSVTGTNNQLWALVIGQLPDVKNGLLGIYHSTDNGKTWALAWTAKAGKQPRSALGVAVVSDKQAVICDEGQLQRGWIATDGGTTFTATDCPYAGFPQWSRSGYLASDGITISLSPDGRHWNHLTP